MKAIKNIFVLFFVGTVFFNCSKEDVNRVEPPARVMLVDKSSDTSTVETGIDAVYLEESPAKNAIFLEWHPNTENALAGYSIYRSEFADRNFAAIGKVSKSFNIIDTTFIDKSVSLNQRYYYFVRAFDDLQQSGEPSDTVSYKVVENPILSSPVGQIGNISAPLFIWDFNSEFIPHFFVFRLERRETGAFRNYYTKLLEMNVDYVPHQEWSLLKLTGIPSLLAGEYRWRIDVIGTEFDTEGAESAWYIFIIQSSYGSE
jgi:hypothetical protein